MRIQEATIYRIKELIKNSNLTPNGLSYVSGVPQATIKSILNGESKNPGILTIKKLCDGLGISISDFFNTEAFNNLDQESE